MDTRRAMPAPHDHNRGLAFDIAVMSRRRALVALGVAGVSTLATGCAPQQSGSGSLAATDPGADPDTVADTATTVAKAPQETQGPYPGDGSNGPNVLIESGVVRGDITSSFGSATGAAEGVPTTLTMTLVDLAEDGATGAGPGAGMAVYVWHCDREGRYSLYSDGVTDQNYLRGVQVAGPDGTVTFTTVFPACYPGRWPHVHFEVFDSLETAVAGSEARLTSQIALPEEACSAVYGADDGYSASVSNMARLSLDTDGVFGDGWTAEMATATGSPQRGMNISITIGVADKAENVAADPGPGGPPPGPPPR